MANRLQESSTENRKASQNLVDISRPTKRVLNSSERELKTATIASAKLHVINTAKQLQEARQYLELSRLQLKAAEAAETARRNKDSADRARRERLSRSEKTVSSCSNPESQQASTLRSLQQQFESVKLLYHEAKAAVQRVRDERSLAEQAQRKYQEHCEAAEAERNQRQAANRIAMYQEASGRIAMAENIERLRAAKEGRAPAPPPSTSSSSSSASSSRHPHGGVESKGASGSSRPTGPAGTQSAYSSSSTSSTSSSSSSSSGGSAGGAGGAGGSSWSSWFDLDDAPNTSSIKATTGPGYAGPGSAAWNAKFQSAREKELAEKAFLIKKAEFVAAAVRKKQAQSKGGGGWTKRFDTRIAEEEAEAEFLRFYEHGATSSATREAIEKSQEQARARAREQARRDTEQAERAAEKARMKARLNTGAHTVIKMLNFASFFGSFSCSLFYFRCHHLDIFFAFSLRFRVVPPPPPSVVACCLFTVFCVHRFVFRCDDRNFPVRLDTPFRTAFEVLGLPPDTPAEEIKQAYRQLALRYHPDRNSDPKAADRFKEINEAYTRLSDALL